MRLLEEFCTAVFTKEVMVRILQPDVLNNGSPGEYFELLHFFSILNPETIKLCYRDATFVPLTLIIKDSLVSFVATFLYVKIKNSIKFSQLKRQVLTPDRIFTNYIFVAQSECVELVIIVFS